MKYLNTIILTLLLSTQLVHARKASEIVKLDIYTHTLSNGKKFCASGSKLTQSNFLHANPCTLRSAALRSKSVNSNTLKILRVSDIKSPQGSSQRRGGFWRWLKAHVKFSYRGCDGPCDHTAP
jgi:hypothetical protein